MGRPWRGNQKHVSSSSGFSSPLGPSEPSPLGAEDVIFCSTIKEKPGGPHVPAAPRLGIRKGRGPEWGNKACQWEGQREGVPVFFRNTWDLARAPDPPAQAAQLCLSAQGPGLALQEALFSAALLWPQALRRPLLEKFPSSPQGLVPCPRWKLHSSRKEIFGLPSPSFPASPLVSGSIRISRRLGTSSRDFTLFAIAQNVKL